MNPITLNILPHRDDLIQCIETRSKERVKRMELQISITLQIPKYKQGSMGLMTVLAKYYTVQREFYLFLP